MFKYKALLTLRAMTSVHVGEGTSLSVVDLPIQREPHTGYPVVRSSSLKGTLRRFFHLRNNNGDGREKEDFFFGPDTDNASEYAGCVVFTDARILLFPVKSFKKTFLLLTCPYILRRFAEDYALSFPDKEQELRNFIDNLLTVSDESPIVANDACLHQSKLILDEFVMKSPCITQKGFDELVKLLDLPNDLKDRIAVISDDYFRYFVKNQTEVAARIRIDSETGVVKKGALWYEESLPPESVLYSVILATDPRGKSQSDGGNPIEEIKKVVGSVMQIGGNETIGKGIVKLHWISENHNKEDENEG